MIITRVYSIFFGGLELEFVSSLPPGAERLGMDAKCRAITGGGGLGPRRLEMGLSGALSPLASLFFQKQSGHSPQ